MNIAVLQHLHYADQIDYLVDKISNLPEGSYDLFVNKTHDHDDDEARDKFQEKLNNLPPGKNGPRNFHFFSSPNIGVDVRGTYYLMEEILKLKELDPLKRTYDLFLKLGTEANDSQRASLIEPLIGCPEAASRSVNLFYANPDVGMIGATSQRVTGRGEWPNAPWLAHFYEYYNIAEEHRGMDFFGGTYFWVRGDIFYKMVEDFAIPYCVWDRWAFGGDANPEHAIERIYSCFARNMGYIIQGVG